MDLEGPQRPCQYAHLPTTPIFFASAADAILHNTSTVRLQGRCLTGRKPHGLGTSMRSESNLRAFFVVDPS